MVKRNIENAICVIVMMVMVVVVLITIQPDEKEGTADSVFTQVKYVKDYLKEVYSDKKSIMIVKGKETKVNCNNHNQSLLKAYYNKYTSLSNIPGDEGICWASAITSLLEFYGATSSKEVISYNTLRIARKNDYWEPGEDGVCFSEEDNILDDLFEYYDIDKEANNDYYDIYNTLVDEVDDGRAVLFSIKGHAMSACGYVPYYVVYVDTNWLGNRYTDQSTENFVIVNDTWAENSTRQYSYFPEREIGTNIFTRWDFGVSKMLDD